MKFIEKANENTPRTAGEIEQMIDEAAVHYGKFLKSMGFDYTAEIGRAHV